jgi:hypothetical protein
MWRPALVTATLLLCVTTADALQSSETVTGRVVSRDGAPRPRCQVEFKDQKSHRTVYRAYTDARGTFALERANRGPYEVTITYGPRTHTLPKNVEITGRPGSLQLEPSVLVVPW